MLRRITPLLIAFALLTAACQIRVDSMIEVNEDETGTFGIEIGFDEEFRQLAEDQGGTLDLSTTDGLPSGWRSEAFASGEFEGTRISTDFTSFADLDTKLHQLEEAGSDGEAAPNALFNDLNLRREGDTFTFEAQLEQVDESFSDMAGGDAALDGIDPAAFLESLFQVRFLVTLPGTVGDHNADEVDGDTLIWSIGLDGQSRTLSASSTVGGSGLAGLLPVLGAAVVVLLLAGVGIAVFRRRSKVSKIPATVGARLSVSSPEIHEPVDGDPFAS
ncbi:MAG: hypothetical protein OEM97_02730 [Acidimicrobiia bacterium]|nr:hypothetical protein [Acidimicrobiia bacterium]